MKKTGKKSTISEPLAKNGRRIGKRKNNSRPADGLRFRRSYPGEDPKMDLRPKPKEDIEAVTPEPQDKASKHQYPPPKKNPLFRTKWMRFIDNVTKRENFNIAHLDSLEILCDLYVEYEDLQRFVRVNGRSYLSLGRSGEIWKFYPEVQHLARVQAQIKEYSKMLGLLLKKDHGSESGGEAAEWE